MVKNERLLLLLLAVIQFSHIVDFMIVMPLGKQLMDIFQISPQEFSIIVSAYSFAAFAAGLIGAFFIDRFDRKTALLFAFAGFTLGTLACAIAPTFTIFLMARSLAGLFGGSLATLVLSIIGDVIPFERRATAMGVIMTAFSVASVAGVPIGLTLAANFGWQMPFYTIGGLGLFVLLAIWRWVPSITVHLSPRGDAPRPNPLDGFRAIFKDRNQQLALLFTMILMLGHFTIIPFIAPYMQLNVGFSDEEVSYIYLFGGLATVVALPMFGRLSDRFGNMTIFGIVSVAAVFSIYAITHLPPVTMLIAILTSTSYFIVASGRNVPATTMVTGVVNTQNRGSFMSVRTSAQQLALGLSSIIAGLIVTKDAEGHLVHYETVGYIAIAMSLLAILIGRWLKVVKQDSPKGTPTAPETPQKEKPALA